MLPNEPSAGLKAHSFATPVVPNTTSGWPWGLRYNSGLVGTAVAAASGKNGVCGSSDSPLRVSSPTSAPRWPAIVQPNQMQPPA